MSCKSPFAVMRFAVLLVGAILNGACSFTGGCVIEGTLVSTPEGPRPIETLREGDEVLTWSSDGQLSTGVIESVHTTRAKKFISITSGDRALRCTLNHLIMGRDGWMEAVELETENAVMTDSGFRTVAVQSQVAPSMRVYDLSVSPNQNYFASGLLVHNKTVAERAREEDLHGAWILRGSDQSWYRFDLRPGGAGDASFALLSDPLNKGQFESKPLEFVSWKLKKYDFEMRLRRSNGEIVVMKGMVTGSVRMYQVFEVDGLRMERPARLFKQLDAIGVTGRDAHP